MPRYRKLHAKVCESLDVQEMPDDFTRLLWVLLPLALDREGRGLDNPAWLKAKVMPLRLDVTPERVGAALDWFAQREMIARYQVRSRAYFWVPTFAHYQGDTARESASEYPAPPELEQSDARAGQELVMSRSRSEADASASAEAATDPASGSTTAAVAAASPGESDGPTEKRVSAAPTPTTEADSLTDLVRRVFPRDALNTETPRVIGDMVGRWGSVRLRAAIEEMDMQNPRKRGWPYVVRILERWEAADPEPETVAPPRDGSGGPAAPPVVKGWKSAGAIAASLQKRQLAAGTPLGIPAQERGNPGRDGNGADQAVGAPRGRA
jgi:hypothetical protein